MATRKRAGSTATFWAVALLLFVLVVIGVVIWMRRTQRVQPTNPATPGVSSRQAITLSFPGAPA